MPGIDKQVERACLDLVKTMDLARPLLEKPHRIRLPGRTRPVELMEPVAMEDVLGAVIRWTEELRDGYRRATHKTQAQTWTAQQLKGFPVLLEAADDLGPNVLTVSEPEWLRRRSRCADQLVAVLLGWTAEDGARTIRRRRGDYDRLLAADLRLAACRECGTLFCRRRSERLIEICELCRERVLQAWAEWVPPLGALEGANPSREPLPVRPDSQASKDHIGD